MRNAYDLAFDRAGELFPFDADIESDIGMSWHRPTRVDDPSVFLWNEGPPPMA